MTDDLFGPVTGRPTTWARIHPADDEWLSRGPVEDAIDPDIPIVDAHHHLIDRPGNTFLLPEFRRDLAGPHRVERTVHIECMTRYRTSGPDHLRPVGETEFLVDVAEAAALSGPGATRVADGIVGFADLMLGSGVREVVDAHLEAGGTRFKGTRFAIGWDESADVPNNHSASGPDMLSDRHVRRGAAVLGGLDLSLDIMAFFHQLQEVAAFAASLPDVTIVLDHCGGPIGHGPYAEDRDAYFRAWSAGIARVAERPNVVCKLGGLLARGAAFDYLTAQAPPTSDRLVPLWEPWILTCIEQFGVDRCMFESNFPVEKMGVGYTVQWNVFQKIVRGASLADQQALFAGTAERVYRLGAREDALAARRSAEEKVS